MKRKSLYGFTLIELLIVVAIIAILAAIAVPNFLEAQVRAKVSRVRNDMRSLATALEAYRVDSTKYPTGRMGEFGNYGIDGVWELTTPIAYMTSVGFADPFAGTRGFTPTPDKPQPLYYFSYDDYGAAGSFDTWGQAMVQMNLASDPDARTYSGYCLLSFGPNRTHNWAEWCVWSNIATLMSAEDAPIYPNRLYDATNGTISHGDLTRFGGDVPGFLSGS